MLIYTNVLDYIRKYSKCIHLYIYIVFFCIKLNSNCFVIYIYIYNIIHNICILI